MFCSHGSFPLNIIKMNKAAYLSRDEFYISAIQEIIFTNL